MYSSAVIQTLADRIGYAQPALPTSIVLETRNATGTSGRVARSFHSLVTVENIWLTMPMAPQGNNVNADNTVLNNYLWELKEQAALRVLSLAFDQNDRANTKLDSCGNPVDISSTDYTAKITANPGRFDEAIGYQLAYMALELMLTTTRSNTAERKVADKGQLRMELEGITDGEIQVSPGIAGKLHAAMKKLIDGLFPVVVAKPTLRARHIW